MKWSIWDIDGVLADARHRLQLALDAKRGNDALERARRWNRYHTASELDPPHEEGIMLLKGWIRAPHHGVIYLTGRPEAFRHMTSVWLAQNGAPVMGIPLIMRPDGDHRPASEFKMSALKRHIEPLLVPDDTISFVVEDHDAIVAMWRGLGLTCIQPRSHAY